LRFAGKLCLQKKSTVDSDGGFFLLLVFISLKKGLLATCGNHFLESVAGLESGDFVSGDDDGGLLRDVACGLFGAFLNDEAAKTANVNIFTGGEALLYDIHEVFNYGEYVGLVNAGALCDFGSYFCFSHCSYSFMVGVNPGANLSINSQIHTFFSKKSALCGG
jgi:uncharacterized membrane protein YeaQ/YmgE (transglycosylase-associated protein family)